MNKSRRKEIEELINDIEALSGRIEFTKEDEEEYHDNIPENLQGSEKAENSQTAIDNLENAIDSLDEAINSLNESIE